MKRAVLLLGCVVVGSSFGASPAAADLSVAGYGEFGSGARSAVGGLESEFKDGSVEGRLAGGLRLGRLSVGGTVSIAGLEPVSVERHGQARTAFGIGPEASVFFGQATGVRPYLRLGLERQWITGASVRRQCGDFSVCETGFFRDESAYPGQAARLALGVEYLWSQPARRGFLLALGAELAYQHSRFRVAGEVVSGGFAGFNLVFRIGVGRRSTW